MTDRFDDEREDPPLDPAMQRVQAKLRRLILVSGSTLLIGFMAVIAAVIFRVSASNDRSGVGETWRNAIELPAGVTVFATDLDGDHLAVMVDGPQGRTVHVYHLPTATLRGSTTLLAR